MQSKCHLLPLNAKTISCAASSCQCLSGELTGNCEGERSLELVATVKHHVSSHAFFHLKEDKQVEIKVVPENMFRKI